MTAEERCRSIQDAILECDIKKAGLEIELFTAMQALPSLGGNDSRGRLLKAEAIRARVRMERLIADRRPEAVAALERARGLAV